MVLLKDPHFLQNEVFLCEKNVFAESENLEQNKIWRPNELKGMMSLKKETSAPYLFYTKVSSFPLNS